MEKEGRKKKKKEGKKNKYKNDVSLIFHYNLF